MGFTAWAGRTPAAEVVGHLDRLFSEFDELAASRGLEKIKTIGDAYMVAAGVPDARSDHAAVLAEFALDMRDTARRVGSDIPGGLDLRIGIASGQLVAGVIGRSKFAYNLWGDTVNTAARMESHGEPGRIQATEETASLIDSPRLRVEPRGEIQVKGKGAMRTFWVETA